MLKATVLATILVQCSKWPQSDLDEAEAFVLGRFYAERPGGVFHVWNTHVPDGWAKAYIAEKVRANPDQIRFGQAFDELDTIG